MRKVLFIEDDPIAATGYHRLLRTHGFDVELAKDGAAGLERLVILKPDAVILDLMLPKVGGLDVLRAIRACEDYRLTPVLVLTGACLPVIVEEAMKIGANQVFDKVNARPLELIQLLHDLLRTTSSSSLVVPTKSGNPDAVFG
jgi:CheY-like chemotaxis protein